MPALQPVPGIARVVVNGLFATVPVVNVMHFGLSTGGGGPLAQGVVDVIATGFRAAYVTRFIPLMNSSFTLNDITATDLTNNLGLVGTATGSTAGTLGGTALPANVAMTVSWKTGRHYRGGHGRTYFPALVTTSVSTPNTWQGATVTAWQSAAASFRTDVNSIAGLPANFVLVLLHRWKTVVDGAGNKVREELVPPTFEPITSAGVDTRIDSQRRRLGKDRPG